MRYQLARHAISRLIWAVMLLFLGQGTAMSAGPLSASPSRCSISVQDLLFGSYDPSSTISSNTVGQFSVNCTGTARLSISVGPSRTTGSISDRRMRHRSRTDTIAYNLFLDPAHNRLWGDSAVGSPLNITVTGRYSGQIFGQMLAGQDAWVGDYDDTVTITVLP